MPEESFLDYQESYPCTNCGGSIICDDENVWTCEGCGAVMGVDQGGVDYTPANEDNGE